MRICDYHKKIAMDTKEDEIFVECKYNKNYQISNYGNVIKLLRNKCVKVLGYKSSGYKTVNLRGICMPIHRLVAEHFLNQAPFGKWLVRHLDDNKENNHVSNLAWGDTRDNTKDAIKNGKWGGNKQPKNWSRRLDLITMHTT